jgi:hypothetical protein
VPISEREPPENWPGFIKEWFKVGRGTATALDGTYQLGKSAVENPEKVPGAAWGLAERTADDPLGTGRALIGYDELASGRYSDWFGQFGLMAFGAGGGTVPSRAHQLNRVAGRPNLHPLGRQDTVQNAKFAGRRFDFTKSDFNAPPGTRRPKMDEETRLDFAKRYPAGVRFTRAGYPVFTPYAVERIHIDDLAGTGNDFKRANRLMGFDETPPDFTWHHVENGRTLELVPSDLHEAVRHTGGNADMRGAREAGIAPGGVMTPLEKRFAQGGAGTGAAVTAGGAAEGSAP